MKDGFKSYLYEIENYGMRVERLELELDTIMGMKRLLEWMEAAYQRGAQDMASNTLETLGDYAAAMEGLSEPHYTASESFDAAADNLKVYYDDIFKDVE